MSRDRRYKKVADEERGMPVRMPEPTNPMEILRVLKQELAAKKAAVRTRAIDDVDKQFVLIRRKWHEENSQVVHLRDEAIDNLTEGAKQLYFEVETQVAEYRRSLLAGVEPKRSKLEARKQEIRTEASVELRNLEREFNEAQMRYSVLCASIDEQINAEFKLLEEKLEARAKAAKEGRKDGPVDVSAEGRVGV
jgi:hypothetical protein